MSNANVRICESAKQGVKSAQGWSLPPRNIPMTITRKVFLIVDQRDFA